MQNLQIAYTYTSYCILKKNRLLPESGWLPPKHSNHYWNNDGIFCHRMTIVAQEVHSLVRMLMNPRPLTSILCKTSSCIVKDSQQGWTILVITNLFFHALWLTCVCWKIKGNGNSLYCIRGLQKPLTNNLREAITLLAFIGLMTHSTIENICLAL